jgi:membrane-anchored mycosin MYCP
VIGFGLLFVAIIAAAAIQLRRAARNPRELPEEPEPGMIGTVDSGRKT